MYLNPKTYCPSVNLNECLSEGVKYCQLVPSIIIKMLPKIHRNQTNPRHNTSRNGKIQRSPEDL